MQVYLSYTENIQIKNLWAFLGGRKWSLIKDLWSILSCPDTWELSWHARGLPFPPGCLLLPRCPLFFAPHQPLPFPNRPGPGPVWRLPRVLQVDSSSSGLVSQGRAALLRAWARGGTLGKTGISKTPPSTTEEFRQTVASVTKPASFSAGKEVRAKPYIQR